MKRLASSSPEEALSEAAKRSFETLPDDAPTCVDGTFTASERRRLLVLCGALFLAAVNVSMISVALPVIGADLGLSTGSLQWLTSAYALGFGGFLLLGGRVADLFGRRRVFQLSLLVGALSSMVGALADDGTVLIVARFVTGIGAAFTAPASLSLITTDFAEGPLRDRALAVHGATGASGFAFGLVVGGLLTTAGWRWLLVTPVVIGAALAVLGQAVLPPSAASTARLRNLDLAGAATFTMAMLLCVYTLVELPTAGFGSLRTVASVLAVVVLFASFVAIERRSRDPLLRFGLFRVGELARACLGAAALEGAWAGCLFVLTLYLQDLRDWSALQTGLAVCPTGLIVAILAPRIAPPLIRRFGLRPVIALGLSLGALAYLLLLRIGVNSGYVGVILPSMVCVGMAFALAFGPLNVAATNGVSDDEQGMAGGVIFSALQLGAALVLAAATAVNAGASRSRADPSSMLDGFHAALVVSLAAAALGVLMWVMPSRGTS